MLLWNILFGNTTQYVPQWVVDFLRGVYTILFPTRVLDTLLCTRTKYGGLGFSLERALNLSLFF